jgi:hypothetical protein
MTHPKLRTAIYARVSTLDQDPAMQLRELRAYAAHRRLPVAAEFIDHVSGTTADRPALERGPRTKRVKFQMGPPRGPSLVDREEFLLMDFCSSFGKIF